MEFKSSEEPDILDGLECTPIVPIEDGEFPDEIFRRIVQRTDGRGGSNEFSRPLIEDKEGYFEIDLESLAHLIWEHRQYSRAQGFSPMQLEVLRTVQLLSENGDLILNEDIMRHLRNQFNENSISTALTALESRGLVTRKMRGVYKYDGFENWSPSDE